MSDERFRVIGVGPKDELQRKEVARRQEIRSNFLVPIYVMWTSNVNDDEARAALQGVQDALIASGQNRDLLVFGSKRFSAGTFSSPDWYIEEAFRRQDLKRNAGYGLQIDQRMILNLFYQEPWQENPHWEVFIVNNDLNARGRDGNFINFVFGSTDSLFPASVQSVCRLQQIKDKNLRNKVIRRLLRHEVGHMFGLPNRKYRVEQKLGSHCTNICTMRQGMSLDEWVKQNHEEERAGIRFCQDCLADLARIRPRFKSLPY